MRRTAELYDGDPANARREKNQQFFKSREKPALSFVPRKNGAAQLSRKNSNDIWHIPSAKETEQYHPYQDDYKRNSLINSMTISRAKKTENMLQRLLIPKTLCPHEIAKITNVLSLLMSKLSLLIWNDTCKIKIAVGCQSRTYQSIHTETRTRVGFLGPRGE